MNNTTNRGRSLDRRSFLVSTGAALAATLLAGCSQPPAGTSTEPDVVREPGQKVGAVQYDVLVNKQNKLPDGWEDVITLAEEESKIYTNDDGSPHIVQVESKAYGAYAALKDDLMADGTFVELDSCYRSVEAQQEIVDDFTDKYGEEYVKQYVAVPGFSEHHTGLALDLYLVIDGEAVYENEEMLKHPKVWKKVHAKLADHGFILRYLPGKKIYTGYSYEPWHIRYLDDPSKAHQIMDGDLTLEEYLGRVDPVVSGCKVDYGTSKLYTESDMDSALDAIMAEFRNWSGCVLKRFAFSGDDACDEEEVAYLNGLLDEREGDASDFDQAIVFATDFHTGAAELTEGTAWDPDTDYTDYTWHLGRTGSDGAWQLMTWGYA